MKSVISTTVLGYLIFVGFAQSEHDKLYTCQGICLFGTREEKCNRCCVQNKRESGHCGKWGFACWCKIFPVKITNPTTTPTTEKATTDISVTTIFPTSSTNRGTNPSNRPETEKPTSTENPYSTTKTDTIPIGSRNAGPIVAATITVVFICMASIIILFCWRRRKSLKARKAANNIERMVCEENDMDKEANFPNIGDSLFYNESYNSISPEEIEMDCNDPSKLLGEGKFGMIYQGKLLQSDGIGVSKWQNVAIKCIKQNSSEVYKKSLLDEIKILAYIGEHNNILKFLGCHTVTNENSVRDTFLILELCTNGNLKDFLSHNYSNFVSYIRGDKFFNNTMLITQRISTGKSFSTKFLLDWSFQIACGMEFLSSKMLIHNDIAARNVLLTDEKTAKISDFGLSRVVDQNNPCYIKKSTDMPIPWPWMAPESLKNYHFSIESDVWSYGVLLWEIFTLGDDPHSNITDDWELCTKLNDGYRLAKPNYSTCEIYLEILLCWRIVKSERPKFESLITFFGKQSEALQLILDQPVKQTQVTIQMHPCSSGKSTSEAQSYLKFNNNK